MACNKKDTRTNTYANFGNNLKNFWLVMISISKTFQTFNETRTSSHTLLNIAVILQEIIIHKQPGEKLGISIRGGAKGHAGNPFDPTDEGIFISKVTNTMI